MNTVLSGKEVYFENLISYRGKQSLEDSNAMMEHLKKFFIENNIEKNGPIISCTHGISTVDGRPMMDVEMLIPVNSRPAALEGFSWISDFHVSNAMMIVYEGSSIGVQTAAQELMNAIRDNNHTMKTPIYVAYLDSDFSDNSEIKVQMYVGV